MDVVADLVAPCSPDTLFGWVDDLTRYPQWLEIVARARPNEPDRTGSTHDAASASGADPRPAWAVDLRARLGPLARSKRLRMVRTACEAPRHARFERVEHDGRNHSAWVLDAVVEPHPDGSTLRMELHYGGGLFGPVLERVLRDEIERSKPRLLVLVTGPTP
jgi:hypothetical protein